ncbi:dihydrofolate reductase family protein [Enteractinococcus coprophilus]|nr:dihydrofolate reductase family protein [Enteractinococcus coprophilus]
MAASASAATAPASLRHKEDDVMGILSYTAVMSLDGYIADTDGDFQWATPSPEIFDAHLQRMSEVSTEIMGRKTYELMHFWDTYPDSDEATPAEKVFGRLWQHIDKIVASSTLSPTDMVADDELVPDLDVERVQRIGQEAEGVVEIFGPTTAADAIRAGLIERFEFFIVPIIIGGGLKALPEGVRLGVVLVEQRTFENGTVYLRYERTA